MSEFCFSFLENQFRDIYLDCARMDKNLIEGDGVEAILIAGRIAEKVTKAIFAFEGIKDDENSQYKRIEKLNKANILPNNIKNDFSKLRRLRNDVYHNTLNSDGTGGFRSSQQANKPYVQNGGLRDYKTGFNEVKSDSSLSDDDFRDESPNKSSLIRLKAAINDGKDFIRLRQSSPDNEIIQILNELYIPKAKEEKDENLVYGINNKEIKIRQPDVPYSQCLGISYDDNLFMWKAEHGDKELGLYQSSKEAFEAREIYISSIPMPRKIGGAYSKARGISFSKIQKLWSVSVKGQIISYHSSENEAIKARKDYLKENGLVDVKVKGGYKTITLEERDKLRAKAKENAKKTKSSKPIKSIDSKSSIKKEIAKTDNSNKKSKLDYAKEFKKGNEKNKVKVENGNKVQKEKAKKKVKVSGGAQKEKAKKKVKVSGGAKVSKSKSKKSDSTLSQKKSSKYEGVFYEEGLFMWSAEVDGKHLGLFPTEEEAHEKRAEYIKNRS